MSFKLLCRYCNPHWVEDVNYMLTTGTETPNCLEPEGCWCGLLVTSEECAWVDHAHHSPLLHLVFKQRIQVFWALDAQTPCLAPANKSFAVNAHCQEFGFLHRRHRSSCQVTVSNFFEEQNWDNRKKDPGPMWRKKKMKGKRKQDVSTLVWTLLWNGESRYQLKWKNKCRGKRRWWTSVPSGKEEGWGGVSGRFQSS